MKSKNIKKLSDTEFKRITGVKSATFEKIIEILIKAYILKMSFGRRKPKLNLEKMLLATLEYLR